MWDLLVTLTEEEEGMSERETVRVRGTCWGGGNVVYMSYQQQHQQEALVVCPFHRSSAAL